jgi:hypothetical protein
VKRWWMVWNIAWVVSFSGSLLGPLPTAAAPLPRVTVTTLSGQVVSSEQIPHAVRWVLVYLTPGCAPCEVALQAIGQQHCRLRTGEHRGSDRATSHNPGTGRSRLVCRSRGNRFRSAGVGRSPDRPWCTRTERHVACEWDTGRHSEVSGDCAVVDCPPPPVAVGSD